MVYINMRVFVKSFFVKNHNFVCLSMSYKKYPITILVNIKYTQNTGE